MAKANPITGGSMFIPAGVPAPEGWNPETGPRLTGPGGAAAEQRYRDQQAGAPEGTRTETRPEDERSTDPDAQPESEGGEQDGAEHERDQRSAPERPGGNASTEVWREYVAALQDQHPDDQRYAGKTRAELVEMADQHDQAAMQRASSHRDQLSPDQVAAGEDQPLAGRPGRSTVER